MHSDALDLPLREPRKDLFNLGGYCPDLAAYCHDMQTEGHDLALDLADLSDLVL